MEKYRGRHAIAVMVRWLSWRNPKRSPERPSLLPSLPADRSLSQLPCRNEPAIQEPDRDNLEPPSMIRRLR